MAAKSDKSSLDFTGTGIFYFSPVYVLPNEINENTELKFDHMMYSFKDYIQIDFKELKKINPPGIYKLLELISKIRTELPKSKIEISNEEKIVQKFEFSLREAKNDAVIKFLTEIYSIKGDKVRLAVLQKI